MLNSAGGSDRGRTTNGDPAGRSISSIGTGVGAGWGAGAGAGWGAGAGAGEGGGVGVGLGRTGEG
jgi:hypothetical protein